MLHPQQRPQDVDVSWKSISNWSLFDTCTHKNQFDFMIVVQ